MNIKKLARALIQWASKDQAALGFMQFCRRENMTYRELLRLDREIFVHIDAYEKIMGGHLEDLVKELLRGAEGESFPVNFYKMARDLIGNRRETGAAHFRYESSIVMKTQWLYDSEWRDDIDNYHAALNGVPPQKHDVAKTIVIEVIPDPNLLLGKKQLEAVLSAELIAKIDTLFVDLLSTCKQENTYSVIDATEELGFNYHNVETWARSKKDWLDVLDECHRYCFAWAEIAGLTRRISPTKAMKYMCENDGEFKNHLEWRKAWEEKPWKKQKTLREIASPQQSLKIMGL